MTDFLIDTNAAISILKCSRSHWFDIHNSRSLRFDPTAPARIYVSKRIVRYWHGELLIWIEKKRGGELR